MALALSKPGIQVSVTVHGVNKVIGTLRQLTRETIQGIADAINRSAIAIDREAKLRAPVDTGRLRSSIKLTFQNRTPTVAANVGTNVAYAKFVEFGTSVLGARTNKQPLPPGYNYGDTHGIPPVDALKGWARRHKMSPWAVAIAIAGRRPGGFTGSGFGTRKQESSRLLTGVGLGTRARIPGLRARPFLFPAFEGERQRCYDAVVRAIQIAPRKAGGT